MIKKDEKVTDEWIERKYDEIMSGYEDVGMAIADPTAHVSLDRAKVDPNIQLRSSMLKFVIIMQHRRLSAILTGLSGIQKYELPYFEEEE